MQLNDNDLSQGIGLFLRRLEEILDEEPEVTDLHRAFDHYSLLKFSFGSGAEDVITEGKNDRGVDFYSSKDGKYRLGQCKLPDQQYLDANPTKPRVFGPSVVHEVRNSLEYLFTSQLPVANEKVKRLYSLISSDRTNEEFHLTFFILIYGRANKQAEDAVAILQNEYRDRKVTIVLKQIDELVDEFVVGGHSAGKEIKVKLTTKKDQLLRFKDACYMLASARGLYEGFRTYGWRLFDLNLRYVIRNSPVNSDIVQTLSSEKGRKRFHYLNNGLLIVVKKYSIGSDESEVTLLEPQIVNGLQTVTSINTAVQEKRATPEDLENCLVQVRIIQDNDHDLVSHLVLATNNQNPMSPRSLRSNSREQKELRTKLSLLPSRWFLQVKDGEWESLNSEGSRFFKDVAGYPAIEFRSEPQKKSSGRVIDNQDIAKAWLAFIGFGDLAGDRTAHYFSSPDVYRRAFESSPSQKHWESLRNVRNFDGEELRDTNLTAVQGSGFQYMLAYCIWMCVKSFVPSSARLREEAIERGVKEQQLTRKDGAIQNPEREVDSYLAADSEYQAMRLMANMKELLVETFSYVLLKKFNVLDEVTCQKLLASYDISTYLDSGKVDSVVECANTKDTIPDEMLFARVLAFLKFVARQHWEENQKSLLSVSRIRTVVLRREFMRDFKAQIDVMLDRKGLDKAWKRDGVSFIDSIPNLA